MMRPTGPIPMGSMTSYSSFVIGANATMRLLILFPGNSIFRIIFFPLPVTETTLALAPHGMDSGITDLPVIARAHRLRLQLLHGRGSLRKGEAARSFIAASFLEMHSLTFFLRDDLIHEIRRDSSMKRLGMYELILPYMVRMCALDI